MLPKAQRLSRSEFATLLKHGVRLHGTHMNLVWMRAGNPTHIAKVGVVVSKKVAPSSVERHRMRRHVYEIVGNHVHAPNGVHIACILKPRVAKHTYATLYSDIKILMGNVASTGHTPSVSAKK